MAQLKNGTTIGGYEALHKGNTSQVATSGSYNDLTNKPTIHTINDSSTTATTNTWSAKKINDSLATKLSTSHASQIGGSSLGHVKSGGDITIQSDGTMQVVDNSHNHTIANVSGLQSALDGKEASIGTKGSAFNKNFGTTSGTVAEGNHTHSSYVNQNAVSKIKVGTTTISASAATDTFELSAGSNISLTPDATNKKITIANTYSYSHPSSHPATMIAQDSSHRFVTDTEKSNWNAKASTAVATTSANGLMSSSDKSKLNGIAANANNYSHPSTHPHTMITGLGTAATVNTGTSAGNVPVLDSSGKLSTSVIPAVAITDTFVVTSETEMLALTAQRGDVAVRSDLKTTFILKADNAKLLENWVEIMTPADGVQSVNGKTGASVTLNASDVGARPSSWVPNWSDVTNKPSASTSAVGLVKLNTATNSTSTTEAATPSAVKAAYDLAASKASTAVATTSANGLMSSSDKSKLNGIAANANNYSHPTSDGNKHVPANGTTNGGKFLQATETAGTYTWASLPVSSTSAKGIVKLVDSVSSTSTTDAATANAVKTAYDKANHSHPYDNYSKWVLSVNTETTPQNMTSGAKLDLKAGSNVTISRSGSTVTIASTNTNTASAVSNILSGSNNGTAVTYAPYTSQQAKLSFDTSTTAPTRNDRLNLNGYLYATMLHVGSESTDSRYFRRGTANTVDVRLAATDGRGLRFSDSDNNKVYMSTAANSTWGGRIGETTSSNNMYFQMKGSTDGFVFKTASGAAAGVDTNGNITAKGSISGGSGAFKLAYNEEMECVDFIFA